MVQLLVNPRSFSLLASSQYAEQFTREMASLCRWHYYGVAVESGEIQWACCVCRPRGQNRYKPNLRKDLWKLKNELRVPIAREVAASRWFQTIQTTESEFLYPFSSGQSAKGEPSACDSPVTTSEIPHMFLYCNNSHALENCQSLRRKPYPEHILCLRMNTLCFGCLSNKNVAGFCPKRKISK